MTNEPIDLRSLGAVLKERRLKRGLSLRRAADEIDVSFNTLARVEGGHIPSLSHLGKITLWLGLPSDFFLGSPKRSPVSTPEVIAQHLRSDPHLGEEGAAKIAGLVRDLYSALVRPTAGQAQVHLRAMKTFEPEAADLLASIIQEMQEKLLAEDQGA